MRRELESLVDASMRDWKIPGLALAVIEDGEVSMLEGYGVRDLRAGDPVTPRTQFLLCSITKSFTAAGIGQVARDLECRVGGPAAVVRETDVRESRLTTLPGRDGEHCRARVQQPPRDLVGIGGSCGDRDSVGPLPAGDLGDDVEERARGHDSSAGEARDRRRATPGFAAS